MNNLPNLREILPNRVRSIRLSRSLTQERLAEAAEIDTTYISRIESGKKIPTVPILCKIADILDVHVYELFLPEIRINSSDYKKKKLFSMVNESGPATLDIYSALLTSLSKLKKAKKI